MKQALTSVLVSLTLSQTTLLYAADKPAAAPVPPPVPEQVRYDLALLAEHGLLAEPDVWAERLLTRPTCDGGQAADLLVQVARAFKPVQDLRGAIDVLAQRGVTSSAEYWLGATTAGRSCGSANLAILLGLIAAHYQPLGITCETAYWFRHVCVEPRVGRRLLHVMLADARGQGALDLAVRARVTKVSTRGDTVTGAEIECAGEPRTVSCRILVDATECGDVIPLTGARYRVGNCVSDAIDPVRRVQDNTWCAVVKRYPQGVPPALLLTNAPPGYTESVHKAFLKSLCAGETVTSHTNKPWTFATFIGYRGMPDSSRSGDAPPITRTHLNYNNDYPNVVGDLENPVQRQKTLRAMRLKTLHLLYYIQNTLGKTDWAVADDEGYDTPYNCAEIDAWLAEQPELAPYRALFYHFPVMAYTRESRRIVGLHTLTAREIERFPGQPVRFASCVALGDYGVDLHGSMRPQDMEPGLDRTEDIPDHRFGSRGTGPFAIPFECFIPEKIDGFLPAEKNISQSRLANGATRLQPHTLLMGQAVGATAALATRYNIQPRALDPVLVQLALLDAGDTLFLTPVADVRQNHPDWKVVQLALTRGMLALDGPLFKPQAAVTPEELSAALKVLSDGTAPPPALALPLTRLEAARAFAAYLEQRACAKLKLAQRS